MIKGKERKGWAGYRNDQKEKERKIEGEEKKKKVNKRKEKQRTFGSNTLHSADARLHFSSHWDVQF